MWKRFIGDVCHSVRLNSISLPCRKEIRLAVDKWLDGMGIISNGSNPDQKWWSGDDRQRILAVCVAGTVMQCDAFGCGAVPETGGAF